MIVYQLHEHSGEYDYYCDRIIGSYLRKERAEEEKAKAEAKEKETMEQSKKCEDCPYLYDAYITNDELLSYCPNAKLEKNEFNNDIDCQNYYVTWDEVTFSIEEVEVEGLSGEWFIDEFPNQNKKFLICSECRAVIDCNVCQIDENEFDFCPYCGADMRKGDK